MSFQTPTLIFIPARGGSKGIVSKNLQMIGGEPLVGRTIQMAQKLSIHLGRVRIVVSSDDSKIRKVAENLGVEVHERSHAISGDDSSTEDALREFLAQDQIWSELNYIIGMLQCTSPFTSVREVTDGVELVRKGFDSAFIGIENHYWLYESDKETYVPIGHKLGHRPGRQKIKPRVHETGAGYFFSAAGFQANNYRLFGKIGFVHAEPLGIVDVDEQSDLEFARILIDKGL